MIPHFLHPSSTQLCHCGQAGIFLCKYNFPWLVSLIIEWQCTKVVWFTVQAGDAKIKNETLAFTSDKIVL